MSNTPRALAVCALLALAGCGGLLPGPDATTDAPTTSVTYPPGLVMNGVSDPTALAEATENALANSSVAYARSVRATRNGTVAAYSDVTARVAPGGRRYVSESEVFGAPFGVSQPASTVVWANETTIAQEIHVNGSVRYAVRDRRWAVGRWSTVRTRVYSLYLALTFDVTHTSDGFTLTSTGVRDAGAVAPRFEMESNVSLTMHLDPDGVVQSFRLEYDATARGDTYHVVETFDVTQLGGVTVERPPWVERALTRENTTSTTAR